MVSWVKADIVVLTAIELEYAAVKLVDDGAVQGSRWVEETHNGLPVALRELISRRGRRLRMAVGRAPDMGKGSALTTLLPLVNTLQPSCIAMCGVCAGRPKKTALGDVIVGERLYDYDAGKWKEVGFDADVRTYNLPRAWKVAAQQFQPRERFGDKDWWQRRPVPYEWQEAWVLLQLHEGNKDPSTVADCKHRCPQWHTVIENLWNAGEVKRNTLLLTKLGRARAAGVAIQYKQFPDLSPGGDFLPFRLHVHPIGSGSAVREDEDIWGFLSQHMRTTLGLEMEASALADIVRSRDQCGPIDAVVMKGVMDFANHGRDDHFKDYAARASAECLIAFLRDQLGGAAVVDCELRNEHELPEGGIDARVAATKTKVKSALQGRDRLLAALSARIVGPCGDLDDVVDRLVMQMPAADLVRCWYDVFKDLPRDADRKADVETLCSVLLAVLPYLTDWRAELAEGLARGDGGRIIVPRFATVSVAEAIMAGLSGRACEFVMLPEVGPAGAAMVQVPASQQTTLFRSRNGTRLREGVVAQLAQQLSIIRSVPPDPELDRERVNETLRARAAGIHEEPVRYYLVYRDQSADPAVSGAEWELALTGLGDSDGVPGLALIRMQGKRVKSEGEIEVLLSEILRGVSPRGGI
jgi:nucleoside phosphorylase